MVNMFNQIMFNITRGYYRCIGSGSSRQVFDLNNGYVAKVARNKAGIEQNRIEHKISFNNVSSLFAKVIKTSNDFSILIMKKAKKINNISYVWKYFNVNSALELLNLKEFQYFMKKYNLLIGDLKKESSWGIINDRPVIIDYGFTKEVKERYY